MQFFTRFSPIRAIQDLRLFLSQRQPYEVVFLFVSIVITTLLIAGFVKDSRVAKPYKREIQYFQSWPADRTDEQIRADQWRDMALKTRRDAAIEKAKGDRQRSFQRVDKAMTDMGL